MKIVIDVPKHIYEHIKEVYEHSHTVEATYSYIYHGTPLPKGHGKIIDADYAIKQLLSLPKNELSTEDTWAMKVLELAPPIIEADKGEADGK